MDFVEGSMLADDRKQDISEEKILFFRVSPYLRYPLS